MAYLYIIRCGEDYKIGVATNVARRMDDLQTGNPKPLLLIQCYRFDNPFHVEQALHQKFAVARRGGEWFNLSPLELETLYKLCDLLGGEMVGNFGELTSETVEAEPEEGEGWLEAKDINHNGKPYWYFRKRVIGKDGKITKTSKYLGRID